MGINQKSQFVIGAALVIVSLTAVIIGLTFGLATPALEDGGSPPGPFPPGPPPYTEPDPEYQSEFGQYRFAAVASDATPCSKIGTDVLARLRGSAVDAAIATMLCVGVCNCHSSGIGGGHFMTIYEAPNDNPTGPKELITILSRERAPAAAHRDMFVNLTSDASTVGGLAIAVPGEIKGFHDAWERYGRVDWSDLFTPSIRLCREGFEIERSLASAMRSYETAIREDPNLSEIFMQDDELLQEGDTLINEKLGTTLETIAADPDAFYNPDSQLAMDIVADIAEYDGIITAEDLNNYDSYIKNPLSVSLDNGEYTVYGPRPPSSGVVIGYIMNILDGYNFGPSDIEDIDDRILTYHRVVEAFKFAYARRSSLGDEEFVDIDELLTNLTSDDYAAYTRSRITDDMTHNVSYYEPDFEDFVDHGTAHASIFAPDGAAVAITATVNLFFGSNVRGSRTGIIFNDEMDDFSTPGMDNAFGVPPSPNNFIVPGKMPMSSMCPTLIMDNDGVVRFVSGGSGGTRITTATSYVAMHSLWFDFRVDDATEHGRIHHQLVPTDVKYESGADQAVLAGLREKGHETSLYGNIATIGSVHNTCTAADYWEQNECVHAVSDGRKGGAPDGY